MQQNKRSQKARKRNFYGQMANEMKTKALVDKYDDGVKNIQKQ